MTRSDLLAWQRIGNLVAAAEYGYTDDLAAPMASTPPGSRVGGQTSTYMAPVGVEYPPVLRRRGASSHDTETTQ